MQRQTEGELTIQMLGRTDAEVNVETGLRAAEKLQSIRDSRDRGVDIAEMWVKLDRVINAVKSAVPEEMSGNIVEKLDQMEQYPESIIDEADAYGDSDDVFDPTQLAEEDDEFRPPRITPTAEGWGSLPVFT
jgi:hypothetical protein